MESMKFSAFTLILVAITASCGPSGPSTLTEEHRAAIQRELVAGRLSSPSSLHIDVGFVVADYELSDDEIARTPSLRKFGEDRLLAIREALLPYGFNDYRVNVNGTPPGTGLIRRYGSSRFMRGGSLEWLPPPRP
jgi:hypothetical protein